MDVRPIFPFNKGFQEGKGHRVGMFLEMDLIGIVFIAGPLISLYVLSIQGFLLLET